MGNSANPIRVLIADEQPLFRDGLRLLLEEEPSFRVIGQAGDVRETVQLTQGARPDVLLLDLSLTSCSGLESSESDPLVIAAGAYPDHGYDHG